MANLENKTIESWDKTKGELDKIPNWEKFFKYSVITAELVNVGAAFLNFFLCVLHSIKSFPFQLSDRIFNNLTFTGALMSAIYVVINWILSFKRAKREKIEKENILKAIHEIKEDNNGKFGELERELKELRKQLAAKQQKEKLE